MQLWSNESDGVCVCVFVYVTEELPSANQNQEKGTNPSLLRGSALRVLIAKLRVPEGRSGIA